MIREILPNCGGQELEQARSMFKMWHCMDCGLEFSCKMLSLPSICPRCRLGFDEEGIHA
jgi:predicted Zn-ribbon and HTH transcriptional regulator